MQTPEGFRSLAELLRAPHDERAYEETPQEMREEAGPREIDEFAAAREVRLFRAHLMEALDAAIETLCNDIATEVVGRELRLAPAEIKAILQRALERYAAEGPVCIRVHPDDADLLACEIPLVGDCALRRGDAVLELRNGTIDASLGVRLDSVLRAFP